MNTVIGCDRVTQVFIASGFEMSKLEMGQEADLTARYPQSAGNRNGQTKQHKTKNESN